MDVSSVIPYISRMHKVKDGNLGTSNPESLAFVVGDVPKEQVKFRNLNRPPKIDKETGKWRNVRWWTKQQIKDGTENYSTNHALTPRNTLVEAIEKTNKTVFFPNPKDTPSKIFRQTVEYYNRFKTANVNQVLLKGIPHVFFVRPSCNLLMGAGDNLRLRTELQSNDTFFYSWKHSPDLVKELVMMGGQTNDFMLSLSNAVASFSPRDEYIETDVYGKTWTGYQIAYGKNNIESRSSGEISITFNDDRDLRIYQIHRMWVEYINGVYRGTIEPANTTLINKILDYVGAIYYIVTAEDGETILFWSKYYGIFPTTVPSTQYSWGHGNMIFNPQIEIDYRYSFKEDFNPYSILEFNFNANLKGQTNYVPVYDPKLGHVGPTWVGCPFIELVENPGKDYPYLFKLRFKAKDQTQPQPEVAPSRGGTSLGRIEQTLL